MKALSQPKVNRTLHFAEPRKLAKRSAAPAVLSSAGCERGRSAQPRGPPGSPGSTAGRGREQGCTGASSLAEGMDTAELAGFTAQLTRQNLSLIYLGCQSVSSKYRPFSSQPLLKSVSVPGLHRCENKLWKIRLFVRGTSKRSTFKGRVAV